MYGEGQGTKALVGLEPEVVHYRADESEAAADDKATEPAVLRELHSALIHADLP